MSLAVRSTPFGGMPLRAIRTTHVEAWVKSMTVSTLDRPALAPGTIKTRFVNVRSVFRAAVRDRRISADPTDGVRLPRQRKRSEALSIPSPDEVARCLAASEERFRGFIAVCALAGLRLGEAAALQFGDVDYDARLLQVRRQVQRAGGKKVEVRRHEDLGHLNEWMFAGGEPDPPHQNTVGARWRATFKRGQLDGIRLHDLRHFYASGLIADGCDVVTVQRALGHAKASTTLDTYARLWPSGEDRTRRAASSLARQVLGENAGEMRAREP